MVQVSLNEVNKGDATALSCTKSIQLQVTLLHFFNIHFLCHPQTALQFIHLLGLTPPFPNTLIYQWPHPAWITKPAKTSTSLQRQARAKLSSHNVNTESLKTWFKKSKDARPPLPLCAHRDGCSQGQHTVPGRSKAVGFCEKRRTGRKSKSPSVSDAQRILSLINPCGMRWASCKNSVSCRTSTSPSETEWSEPH